MSDHSKATPRPWVLELEHEGDYLICGPDRPKNFVYGCTTYYPSGISIDDARLIVTAVNAHDALAASLTDCLKFCEIQRRRREHKGLEGPFLNNSIDNARAALRLAGVKE